MSSQSTPILIPIKDFTKAKLRLSTELDEQARQDLSRQMGTHLIQTAQATPFSVFVVCEDTHVKNWAQDLGVEIIWNTTPELNHAVELAAQQLEKLGYTEMIVSHSDLPHIKGFDPLLGDTPISIAPDRHEAGTNVMRVPLNAGFVFQYGKNSLQLHLAEAKRLNLEVTIVRRNDLSLDIDSVDDLRLLDLELFRKL